jgi:hypothetical protein
MVKNIPFGYYTNDRMVTTNNSSIGLWWIAEIDRIKIESFTRRNTPQYDDTHLEQVDIFDTFVK